jgi:SAM-dependent methyltransferase
VWQDYKANYSAALADDGFLAWREIGAQAKARNVVEVCRGIRVRSILEIGCGTGAVIRTLQAMGFAEEYACIDIALSAVQFARSSCAALSRASVGSAGVLPFRDRSFTVAVLSHVIEHLEDPAAAVREASRVAEAVVVEIPTEKVATNFVRTRILGRAYSSSLDAGHLQFWSPRSIEAFLKNDCGMQIVARHLDLLDHRAEFHGKTGWQLAKPVLKQTFKKLLPGPAYAQLLTTHATFLCRRKKGFGSRGAEQTNDIKAGVS